MCPWIVSVKKTSSIAQQIERQVRFHRKYNKGPVKGGSGGVWPERGTEAVHPSRFLVVYFFIYKAPNML